MEDFQEVDPNWTRDECTDLDVQVERLGTDSIYLRFKQDGYGDDCIRFPLAGARQIHLPYRRYLFVTTYHKDRDIIIEILGVDRLKNGEFEKAEKLLKKKIPVFQFPSMKDGSFIIKG